MSRSTVLCTAALALLGCARDRIPAPALADALQADRDHWVVVDVRSDREFAGPKGHIEGALHIPFPVRDRLGGFEVRPDQEVVLICLTGHRSRWAMGAVRDAVDVPVVDLRGGMMRWWRRDLPVVVESASQ